MIKGLLILLSSILLAGSAAAQFNPISFRNISINEGLSQSSVVDIAIDSIGFLWFATQDGLNRYDAKEFLVFKKNFDDFTTASGSTTGKLAIGNRNDLWIITSGGRLERMNLYDQTIIKVPMLNRTELPPVSCVFPDKDHLWIGTESNGLFIYNLDTKELVHHSTESASLSGDQIQEIYKDQAGRMWILTENGLSVFDNLKVSSHKFLRSEKGSKKTTSCSSVAQDSK